MVLNLSSDNIYNLIAGANQKSSSHFHCLKCDYYCTDTNKVRMHKQAVHIH